MDGADHHAKADELLERARTEEDSIRRSLTLAEAQVHATLAAAAAPEMALASPREAEAADTESAGETHSGASGPVGVRGTSDPDTGLSDTSDSLLFVIESPAGPGLPDRPGPAQPVGTPGPMGPPITSVPAGPVIKPDTPQLGVVPVPARPVIKPDPARPASPPDDSEEEKPDDLDEQEPGGPKKQEPGAFTPLS